jgi:PQQ-dependent dehydrogenase (methanol/ethanol family)
MIAALGALCSHAATAQSADGGSVPPAGDIRPDNVAQLAQVFAFRTGAPGGHAGAPVAAGGALYVLTPFPHKLYALSPADGRVIWQYQPEPDPMAEGLATQGAVIGAPAFDAGRLYLNTLDGHTTALDPASGRVLWDARVAAVSKGETLRSSPLPAGDRVYVGNAGDDFGARGWLAALDAASGREVWRRYSTGSDAEVGIGPGFKPPYPDDASPDRGIATWPSGAWQHGGGGVSGPLLLDVAATLLIHGTGHPAPLNPEQRPGGNRWTSGLFARDPATGAARWFTPINPHDLFGLGATGPNISVDRDWRRARRKLLVHADANGLLYVLERETGRILSAEPFAPTNATGGVELSTGALLRNPAKAARFQTMARDVCPGLPGAIGGTPAYLETTGLVYLPVSRLCMDFEARNTSYIAGTAFTGANIRLKPPREGSRGALVAWDLEAGRPAWSLPEPFPLAGGVLATAGGVVIYGTLDGHLKAVDARDGRPLWETETTSGIVGDPITFRGPDDHAYLAVMAGRGGPLGRVTRSEIDERDASAAGGAANVLRDLPKPADESGTLYVFRLP